MYHSIFKQLSIVRNLRFQFGILRKNGEHFLYTCPFEKRIDEAFENYGLLTDSGACLKGCADLHLFQQ